MADDLVVGGPQPDAPARPSVDIAELAAYYQSIEEPFNETKKGLEKERAGLSGAIVVFFLLSLIPLLPFVISKLVWRYFSSTVISTWKLHFHLGSFWFWWIVFFITSLGMLLIAVKISGVSEEEKKKWLSLQQMRFMYCYGVLDEIRTYRTNHMQRHIDAAID
jgi:hypothetical protein